MNFIWDEPSTGLWHLVPEGAEDIGISLGKIKKDGEYYDMYFPERSSHMIGIETSLEEAKSVIERLICNRVALKGFLKTAGVYGSI